MTTETYTLPKKKLIDRVAEALRDNWFIYDEYEASMDNNGFIIKVSLELEAFIDSLNKE